HLDPVADRIGHHDQVLDVPLVGQPTRAARELHAVLLEVRRKRVERDRVLDLPAIERRRVGLAFLDDHALLAVVHAERQGGAAPVDQLQAEEAARIGIPVLELAGADADVPQRLQIHARSPADSSARTRRFYHGEGAQTTPADGLPYAMVES